MREVISSWHPTRKALPSKPFSMRIFLLLIILALLPVVTSGTHLRAGYIQVKRVNPTNGVCEISIVVYTSANATVKIGGDADLSYLYFGDGQKVFVPETQSVVRYDLDASGGISEARFVTMHAYSSFDMYKLSYTEPNRNAGVLNMDNSINTPLYLETVIMLNEQFVGTPTLLAPPIFFGITGEPFAASIAAIDSAEHTLFYQSTTPGGASNYKLPGTFSLNLLNGQILWDTKFMNSYQPGEYAFAAKIKQFDGDELLSTMIYDFQIILNEGSLGKIITGNKSVNENGKIYVPLNTMSTFKVFAEDSHAEEISIDIFSELINEEQAGSISFSTYDSSNNGKNIKVGVISVVSTNDISRDNPYPLVVRGIYDRGHLEYKDLTYLIYTRDVEPNTDIVLSTGEENAIINIYPNPVNDVLYVDDDRVKMFAIYSMDGVLLRSGVPSENRLIDVRTLTAGFYVLKLNAGINKGEVVKLIKQ
jgi:hypothetical protein